MILNIAGLPTLVEGSGKPLLMLHGYLSSKESFAYQIKYFSRLFTVVAPDMTGFNGTAMPFPYSLDDYKDEICRLIKELHADKIDVIAHSFGARVLLKMLPDSTVIDKIVLTGAAGLKPKFSLKRTLKIARYKLLKHILPQDRLSGYGSSDYRALSPVMKESFKKIISEPLDYRLKLISNAALIIEGENDRETPTYMAKRFKRGLKNSTLVVIRGAGHFAFVDKPNEFNLIVKEFLLG